MKILSIRFEEFETFEEAEARASGYNNEFVLEGLPRHKHSACLKNEEPKAEISYLSSMAALLSAASFYEKRKFNVVDVGGSIGEHYGLFSKLYRGPANFHWHVVETEVKAKYGNEFIIDKNLSFHEKIESIDIGQVNILHLSGVLGYMKDPIEFIESNEVKTSDFIILNRTSIIPGNSIRAFSQFVTYDKGEMSCAGRAIGDEFLQETLGRTHDIEMIWENRHESFRTNLGTLCTAGGMLCRRKDL